MLLEYMKSVGYTDEDILLILSNSSVSGYSEEVLYNKFRMLYNYLLNLFGDKIEVLRMIRLVPSMLGLEIDNMKKKIIDMEEMGYQMKM